MSLASNDSPIARMERLLTCAICLETFNDPRTLPCFHSFCKSCLGKFVKSQRDKALAGNKRIEEFECPSCRSMFTLKPNEDVQDMGSSYFIRDLLDVVPVESETSFPKCSLCETEQASLRCLPCEVFLCEKCSEVHENLPAKESNGLNGKHEVVSAGVTSEEGTTPQSPHETESQDQLRDYKRRCLKHDKTLKFYCKTCKEFVCRHCMEFDHGKLGHSCLPSQDVTENKRLRLKRSVGILQGSLKKGKQTLQAVSDATQRLEQNLQRAKDEVNRHKQEILDTFVQNLEQAAHEKNNELDQEYHKVYEPLAKQTSKIKSYVDKVKVAVDFTESLLEKGTQEAIISSQEVIEKKAEELEKRQPKPLKPVHYGHIQYISKPLQDPNFTATFADFGQVVCGPLFSSLHNAGSEILKNEEEFVDQLEEWLNERCKWRLCYRATRDGWTAQDFHTCCDDKGPTVSLVEVGDFIFGGFTDQSWEGSGYKESSCSFLFSLRNNDGLQPFKAPIFQHHKNAIWNNPNYGPCFGYGFYGCDLYISNNPHICSQSYSNLGYMYQPPEGYSYKQTKTYSLLAGSYYFQPTEIEVFY